MSMFSVLTFHKYHGCSTFTLCWILFFLFLLFNALSNTQNPEADANVRRSDETQNNNEDVDVKSMDIPKREDHREEIMPQSTTNSQLDGTPPTEFQSKLNKISENNIIVLCVVDSKNVYFALNLYETSLKRQNILNYMFVSTNTKVADELRKRKLNYFPLFNDDGKPAYDPSSKEYQRQMIAYKRKVASEALKIKLLPLISDPDIHLFRNPLPDLLRLAHEAKWDILAYTAGLLTFAMFLPTKNCEEMHRYIDDYKGLIPDDTDDEVINNYLQWMLKREENPLRVYSLDQDQYVTGEKYFIMGRYSETGCNYL